jgi:hypothetical protein
MSSESLGSVSWPVFVGLTLIMFGWVGYMTANALAKMWRPWWHNVVYALMLAFANRFLEVALFQGSWSWLGYIVSAVYLTAIMLLAYRVALSRGMVTQYPWLYERASPIGWQEKTGGNQ